jgi:hypothetical protein
MKTFGSFSGCFALVLLAACSSDDDNRMNTTPGVQTNALSCAAGAPRACPCVTQGTGMQVCNATGNGYGACTGCPPAPPPPPTIPSAGSMAPPPAIKPDAGKPMTTAGSAAPTPDAGMTMAHPDAGMGDAGESEADPQIGAVKGVSCGVGLPALCEIGKQKCCVRSLQTDTCIDESAMCSCELQGCTVMQTHCDGPEDCENGQVCCGTLAQNGNGYTDFVCAAQCQATGQQRIACHDTEDKCPSNLICANSQLLTNVQICIDPSTIEQ